MSTFRTPVVGPRLAGRKGIGIELLAGALALGRAALVALVVCGIGTSLVPGTAAAGLREPAEVDRPTSAAIVESATRPVPLARGLAVSGATQQAPKFLLVGVVSSVQEAVQEEKIATALPVEYVRDATLELGREALVTPGAAGETVRTWRVRLVDGREETRTLLTEQVVRAPVAEVWRVGTKPRPTPTPQPPVAPAAIEKIIRDAAARWGADPVQLLRVAWCESRFNPNAYNPSAGDSGLFQFIPATWARHSPRAGYAGVSPFDPVANANTAAMLFSEGQARLWVCK